MISIDYRGMGDSDKPLDGYEKKTIAKDLFDLAHQLGYENIDVVGHDIGSQVAYSFAANFPNATLKLIMIDIPHPDQNFAVMTMLPAVGQILQGRLYPRVSLVVRLPPTERTPRTDP